MKPSASTAERTWNSEIPEFSHSSVFQLHKKGIVSFPQIRVFELLQDHCRGINAHLPRLQLSSMGKCRETVMYHFAHREMNHTRIPEKFLLIDHSTTEAWWRHGNTFASHCYGLGLTPGFDSWATCEMSFTLHSQCLVVFPLGFS